jgi:hypothetical protein
VWWKEGSAIAFDDSFEHEVWHHNSLYINQQQRHHQQQHHHRRQEKEIQ